MANETDKLGIILETTSEGTGFEDVQSDFEETKQSGEASAKAIETSYQDALASIRNASAIAFAAVGAAIGLSVREAAAGEQGIAGFRASVRNAGGDADLLAARLNETAMSLQRLTGIADDDYVSAAQRMTDITGDAAASIDNLNLVADFAVARKIDMSSAADMVARAMEGEVGMLARLLPGLDEQVMALGENADKGEIAGVIFDRLAQFQGRAADSADTTSGSMNILKGEISQTAENIGNAFLPAVRSATEALTDVAKAAGDFAAEHETATVVIGGTATAVIGLVASLATIVSAAPVVKKALDTIKIAASGLASPFAVIASGIVVVGSVMYQLRDAMTATGDSEEELNAIVDETGISYQTLRQKQEEIFGKFADYRSGTDAQREAWDNYVAALKAGMPTLDEVIVTAQNALAGISKSPLKPLNLQVNEAINTTDPSGGFDFADQDQAILDGQIYLNDRITADNEQTSAETLAIWQSNRDAFLYHTGYLQDTYRTAIGTLADTEMTGKERREAIWGQFRSSVVGYIGDVTARYIFGEAAKRAASLATATVGITASTTAAAAEVGNANKVTASWMAAAYAKLVAFYGFAGPLAPVLAVGTIGAAIAGIGAVVASAMGAIKMQEGGIVPGSGRGDRVPAMLEPGERVINRDQYSANAGAIETAIAGRGGSGNTFHFHLNKETSLDSVLQLRQMFETWVVPVIEQKQREGAFTRVGVPA